MVKRTETNTVANQQAAAKNPESSQDSTGMQQHEGQQPGDDTAASTSGTDTLTAGQGDDLRDPNLDAAGDTIIPDETDPFDGDFGGELDDEIDDIDFEARGDLDTSDFTYSEPGAPLAHRETATAPHTSAPIGEHQVENPYLSADQKKPFLDPHEHSHGTGPEAPGPVGAGEEATLREGNDSTSTNDEIDEHRTAPGEPEHAVTTDEPGKDAYTGEKTGDADDLPDGKLTGEV